MSNLSDVQIDCLLPWPGLGIFSNFHKTSITNEQFWHIKPKYIRRSYFCWKLTRFVEKISAIVKKIPRPWVMPFFMSAICFTLVTTRTRQTRTTNSSNKMHTNILKICTWFHKTYSKVFMAFDTQNQYCDNYREVASIYN